VSKLSACTLGYYDDTFLKFFVGKKTRRSPLINRGYYARVAAMDMVIDRFMEQAGEEAQIVALGAGSDTTYFRRKENGRGVAKLYVEVDLERVIRKKLCLIKQTPKVLEVLGVEANQVDETSSGLFTPKYVLSYCDLREVDSLNELLGRIPGFSFETPTLFISECVLCYVKPCDSNPLLRWMSYKFDSCAFVSYEQILPDDAFGRTMLGHFERRGCPLLSIRTYPDVESQQKRLEELGFDFVQVFDMNDIYYKCIDRADVARAEKLEIFDEFEEWHLMQAHYCIVLSVKRGANKKLENLKLLNA